MHSRSAIVISCDLVTAFGDGLAACWHGLMEGRSAASEVATFETSNFVSDLACMVPDLSPGEDGSRVIPMIDRIRGGIPTQLPDRTEFFLATTVGDIESLEREVGGGEGTDRRYSFPGILQRCGRQIRESRGHLISAACASSTVALARAASLIETGELDAAIVVGCDGVSEFVFSGFSALGVLDPRPSRPYDRDRAGLNLGESAGLVVLVASDLHPGPGLGRISGWGMSCDGEHMTSPSSDGGMLASAMGGAIRRAGLEAEQIGGILGHGTGTIHNDRGEMSALSTIFDRPRPLFSTKSGVGHTLGAAGIVQAVIGVEMLRRNCIPPQGGLDEPMSGARGWVSRDPRELQSRHLLSFSAGFGGINAAIVVSNDDRASDLRQDGDRGSAGNIIRPSRPSGLRLIGGAQITVQDDGATCDSDCLRVEERSLTVLSRVIRERIEAGAKLGFQGFPSHEQERADGNPRGSPGVP